MQQRKPRFEPIPQGKYVGHEPHLILLEHIYKHRFIDSRLAELLLQGLLKRDAVIRNLNTLFHEGYITRPPSQIKYYQRGGGSRPLISGLAKKGAKLLERHLGHRISHLEWNGDKNATSDTHIQHTLGIARFMILLELSCRQHNVRIIEPEEILTQASSEVRFKKFPFQWTVQYEGQMVGVSPDKVFGLHYLDEPEGKNKAYFFLENDEGGMPLKRSDFRQTSYYRKFITYYETWRQGLHTELFGIKNFRMLTATTTRDGADVRQRIDHMIELQRELTGGSKMFLFLDKASVYLNETVEEGKPKLTYPDILTLPWRNGKDDTLIRLLD